MKRSACVALVAVLAACGGSDNNNNGGGGGSIAVTGPITGNLANTGGVNVAGSCSLDLGGTPTSVGFALVGLAFSTAPNLCSGLQSGVDPRDAVILAVSVSKFSPTGASVSIGPGTYTISTSPTFDLQGNATIASAEIVKNGTTTDPGGGGGCVPAQGPNDAHSGTVTITSVSSTRVAGSVNATLSPSGTVTGSFDVPLCTGLNQVTSSCDVQGIPATLTCG